VEGFQPRSFDGAVGSQFHHGHVSSPRHVKRSVRLSGEKCSAHHGRWSVADLYPFGGTAGASFHPGSRCCKRRV